MCARYVTPSSASPSPLVGRDDASARGTGRRRPPVGWVVLDPAQAGLEGEVDWSSWYLTDEDDEGVGAEQFLIAQAVYSTLLVLARERGWSAFVGRDQFFAWAESEPLVRVSPDAYVLGGKAPSPLPAMWETWRPGHAPPRVAVEVVSEDTWLEDYEDNPPKYSQLGVEELVIFDPWAVSERRPAERVPLQVFRRTSEGALVRVHADVGPARSDALSDPSGALWWVVTREPAPRLRIARDAAAAELVPTEAEALNEKDRALREALAELERLRGGRQGPG